MLTGELDQCEAFTWSPRQWNTSRRHIGMLLLRCRYGLEVKEATTLTRRIRMLRNQQSRVQLTW